MHSFVTLLADGPLAGGWLWSIIIGIVVGAIAKFLTPGRDPGGCIVTMLIGIIGAAIATAIGRQIGFYSDGQTAGLIPSIIGAVLVLAIYHLITRGRGRGV